MKKAEPGFTPTRPELPLFLLSKSGRPLVWSHDSQSYVLGYSDGPLAVAAARQLQKNGVRNIRVLSVSTAQLLQQVIAQLALHGVHSMIWDYSGGQSVRQVIQLATIITEETR